MARALWKGALSFGLVSIPVEVHTAVKEYRPHFRMLHAKDRSPVSFERVCQQEGKVVPWKDLVRGYEYEKGRFVVLTKEDFASAALEKTQTIDILDFVNASAIDDRFFDTPYYLVPDKSGASAYSLLREAIRESGRLGIAKFIMREVQHLAAVEVVGNALVLSTLRFADELVETSSLALPPRTAIRKKDLDLATTLVENLAEEWNPAKYTDDYRANLMKVIKAKMKGKAANLVSKEPRRDATVVDLMERLRQSLNAAAPRKQRTSTTRRKTARATQPRQATRTSRAS